MANVTITNKSMYPETITYNSDFGSRSLIINGGSSLIVRNTALSTDGNQPDNILNLPPNNSVYPITINDFKYNRSKISIKIDNEIQTFPLNDMQPVPFATKNADADTVALFTLSIPSGSEMRIYWGDGQWVDVVGPQNDTVYSHTYGDALSHSISVSGDYDKVTKLLSYNPNSYSYSPITFPLSSMGMMTNLIYLHPHFYDSVTGSLDSLSTLISLEYFINSNWMHTYTGDFTAFETMPNLKNIGINNSSTTGNISSFSGLNNLESISLESNPSIVGDLSNLSTKTILTYLSLYSSPGITGNMSDISGLTNLEYLNLGSSSITGDISNISGMSSLEYLDVSDSSISGNISAFNGLNNIHTLWTWGSSITGDISNLTSTLYNYIDFWDMAAITGSLSDLGHIDRLGYLDLTNTSVTGDIADLWGILSNDPVNETYGSANIRVWLSGSGVNSYTKSTIPSSIFANGYLRGTTFYLDDLGLSQQEVDDFLVDMDNVWTFSEGGSRIIINGTNAAPSATGSAAAASLISKGWSLVTTS